MTSRVQLGLVTYNYTVDIAGHPIVDVKARSPRIAVDKALAYHELQKHGSKTLRDQAKGAGLTITVRPYQPPRASEIAMELASKSKGKRNG